MCARVAVRCVLADALMRPADRPFLNVPSAPAGAVAGRGGGGGRGGGAAVAGPSSSSTGADSVSGSSGSGSGSGGGNNSGGTDHLTIITGKGKNSDDREAVLRPGILSLLRSEHPELDAALNDTNDGRIEVKALAEWAAARRALEK